MPQMAPLSWLSLYFLFILIFISFNIINYFSINYNKSNNFLSKKLTLIYWKW